MHLNVFQSALLNVLWLRLVRITQLQQLVFWIIA